MKDNKKRFIIKILLIAIAIILIAFVAVVYIVRLNQTISGNIIQNISELAEHDQNCIQNYVESTWTQLENIQGKFNSYHCKTIKEIETQMNIERANSEFTHIYLVAADGKVYTDKFVVYDPNDKGANGRINILPLFDDGKEKIVERFDDKLIAAGLTNESVLYGIRLKNFTVEGIEMAALVGITDISDIQDKLVIDNFTKDGVSSGYGAVIDKNGNYVVNVEQTAELNKTDNFFDRIDEGQKTELDRSEIISKMESGESFSFYCTGKEGDERIVYCMQFENEDIPWYFLSSVNKSVFDEQNRTFLVMNMVMLVSVLIIIIAVFVVMMISRNKVVKMNAEANARSAFLANMSHEIRTPLNGIIGLLYLLEKDIERGQDKTVIRTRMQKTRETAEYLLSLLNNILDISKLQAGKASVGTEIISVDKLLDELQSIQKGNFEHQGVNLLIEKEITLPWIVGDELMIKQVLLNILSNAAKFTPLGGNVRFSVRQKILDKKTAATTFTCADTGCGMSEKFLEHIWDSFSQERDNNDESIKGTGLGMAITKLLVDMMGGEIRVESRQEEGSTFYVTFYSEIVKETPDDAKNPARQSEIQDLKKKKYKILVAEDNELNAEILIEILEDQGFDVLYAKNGQEALEMFRLSSIGEIHVILMDMQMPVMDGCEATVQIRRLDREDAGTVLIYACTANNFGEDRERAEQCGMNDFLAKPVDMDKLLQKIEETCGWE